MACLPAEVKVLLRCSPSCSAPTSGAHHLHPHLRLMSYPCPCPCMCQVKLLRCMAPVKVDECVLGQYTAGEAGLCCTTCS